MNRVSLIWGVLLTLASACSGESAEETQVASSEQALSCSNWATRTVGYPGNPIGCCNRTTMRYRSELCVYGTWVPNGSACAQTTSYCSLCGPYNTSCGG